MAKRSAAGKIAHDKGIYREAINLKRKGWYVLADHVPGFSPPPEIEGFVPDIYAIKDSETLIIEVETNGTDDQVQHNAFQKYADNFESVTLEVWIVNRAGIRLANHDVSKIEEQATA